MLESGIVIFKDGTLLSFGNYVGPGDSGYEMSPTHTRSFMDEIVPSDEFKLSDYIYNEEEDIYHNAAKFSYEGMIYVANHQYSTTSPTEILVYVPDCPTIEQLKVLKNQKNLLNTEIQEVYKFNSLDFSNHEQYQDLNQYIDEKENSKTL